MAVTDQHVFQSDVGNVGDLDFDFLRGAARLAALGDALFAGPGGLRQLIVRAVAFGRLQNWTLAL